MYIVLIGELVSWSLILLHIEIYLLNERMCRAIYIYINITLQLMEISQTIDRDLIILPSPHLFIYICT